MSTPYVGEIRLFGFSRVPNGWFACTGQLVSIADYQVLYTLLGTTYGGDGITTFGVPDLRGRVPLHWGNLAGVGTFVIGQTAGEEAVTLTGSTMPSHNHNLMATTATATTTTPGVAVMPAAIAPPDTYYMTASPSVQIAATSVSYQGGGLPHENRAPILAMNFCIAWAGVFPSQN